MARCKTRLSVLNWLEICIFMYNVQTEASLDTSVANMVLAVLLMFLQLYVCGKILAPVVQYLDK